MRYTCIVLRAGQDLELNFVPEPSFVVAHECFIRSVELDSEGNKINKAVITEKLSTWEEVGLQSLSRVACASWSFATTRR